MSEVFDIAALEVRPVLKPLNAVEAAEAVDAMKALQTELAELRKLLRVAAPVITSPKPN